MEKWADYCVSKLSLNDNGFIESIIFYKDYGDLLSSDYFERNRPWMVNEINKGKTFCSIKKNNIGKWNTIGNFEYDGKLFSWQGPLPKNLSARKTFVSYYHKDDQDYRELFDKLFDDLIISKSVEKDDIDTDNSTEYTKQLINKHYLDDTTILVVLIGNKTKCRKYIDWEIYGTLDFKVGEKYAGILGLFLPTHPNFGSDKYTPDLIPLRLHKNKENNYAILRDWTEDRVVLQGYIEKAFSNREKDNLIINKEIQQMKNNTCE